MVAAAEVVAGAAGVDGASTVVEEEDGVAMRLFPSTVVTEEDAGGSLELGLGATSATDEGEGEGTTAAAVPLFLCLFFHTLIL